MIEIDSVELREIRMPLVHFFETSFGRTYERRIILVTVRSSEGEGYGECAAPEAPLYNSETTETAWHILSEFVAPAFVGSRLRPARDAAARVRHIRGNRLAIAAMEMALWDLQSRQEGKPLSRFLGGTRAEIDCGVSIGIQESVRELLHHVRREISAGYQRVKIKIKPGWEVEPLTEVRREFPRVPLMVDANAAFTLDDLPLLKRLDDFDLMMIEQPLAHDDLIDHARLQGELRTPICLDESIHHLDDVRKAIELGSCRIVNVKLGRVGGYREALRIHEYCGLHQIPLWCGGMLETGIGRAHNIARSSLSTFCLPGDVSASQRYYARDTISPPVTVSPQGTIRVPDGPGIGFDLDWDHIRAAPPGPVWTLSVNGNGGADGMAVLLVSTLPLCACARSGFYEQEWQPPATARTIETVSSSLTGVSRSPRNRMSSSLR